MRADILSEYIKKSQLDLFQKNTQKQFDQLNELLENYRGALRFLLSTNKQFQNEIQKKEFKATTQAQTKE